MRKTSKIIAFAALAAIASSCGKELDFTIDQRVPNKAEFQQRVLTVTPGANLPDNAEAVDLGLSVKWANMNLGSKTEKDAGDLYAWGEITPSQNYGWFNYEHNDFHANDEQTLYLTKYCFDKYGEKQDIQAGGINLDRNDDAAYVQWGADWRMPTYAEMQELAEKCTLSYDKSTKMITVTGPNGNSIQIAEASILVGVGTYKYSAEQGAAVLPGFWSSTLDNVNSFDAAFLNLAVASGKASMTPVPRMNRCFGLPIRPVSTK